MKNKLTVIVFNLAVNCALAESKWDHAMDLRVTRCFEVVNVKHVCEKYETEKKDVLNAEFEIEAVDFMGHKFSYGYGKTHPIELCLEHKKMMEKLIKNSKFICITGEAESKLENEEYYYRFRALESKNGSRGEFAI